MLCVCVWQRADHHAHMLCSGEQHGSVEAQRWQVDPYQSPLSLQGSNCSRPQTFTFTPPTEKMLRLPSSHASIVTWSGTFKDRISLIYSFSSQKCTYISVHDSHSCRSQPDCHSYGKKTLCKAWKFARIYNFTLVKMIQRLIFDEITVLLCDNPLEGLHIDIKSLKLFCFSEINTFHWWHRLLLKRLWLALIKCFRMN